MGFEQLSSPAAWGHLDGVLVYPMWIGENHVLITEDGYALLVPTGMRVEFAGRLGIDSNGIPGVDPLDVTAEDIVKISQWGARMQSQEVIEAIRATIEKTLAQLPNPSVYVHHAREEVL